MSFTPTPEQQAIVLAATDSTDNLAVVALAGAAKTSTLVLIAEALRPKPILAISFNKKIAEELGERLPINCTSQTLNSLGHRAWASYLGKRLNLDRDKMHNIITGLIKGLPKDEQDEAWENLSEIKRLVSGGKLGGFVPDGQYTNLVKPLHDNASFLGAALDEDYPDWFVDIIIEASVQSLHLAYQGTIDFDDQVLCPTVFPAVFDFYPVVMVDEAQDLSALNHAMLRKIAKKRLIAVGDPRQAVYGFRGAHEDSMHVLKAGREMRELPLTVSFRCPIAVVEEARWRAPMMQWPEWAKPGSVERLGTWSIADIPEGDVAILCRNNAPLFSMAIRMLRDGRYPELVGNEIGKALLKILSKFGHSSMPRAEVLEQIELWRAERLEKVKEDAKGRIHDQAECLRVFASEGATLGKAIEYAERIFSTTGPVKLMTGHKSKGLEFDTVFILDRDLLDVKGRGQDKNLLYVMQTRSKNRLVYVNSGNYESTRDGTH